MKRCDAVFSLIVFCLSSSVVQAQSRSFNERELHAAFREGYRFKTDLTVRNNITAQAVLLPYPVAKRVFGTEIAKSYVCIEINIANKSRDAAFILHGLFLDYSDWALSGFIGNQNQNQHNSPDSLRNFNRRGEPGPETLALNNQTSTQPGQVASVEYRLARGQLLDAQQWTARNWTVRLLTVAGTIASGYSFSFKEKGIAKGIAAFSGAVVPGVANAWPDETIQQLNRISDFGYQTNKVVTKEDGEIVVAFFPIDRFLTPGLRQLFIKSPALFFNPFSIFYDRAAMKLFTQFAPPELAAKLPRDPYSALAAYGEILRNPPPDRQFSINDFATLDEKFLFTLNQTSLNTVHIVVDGIMTVDVASIPAKISTFVIDNDTDPSLWSEPGEITGTIRGSFLGGGQLKIAEAETLGVTDIATVSKDSNDQVLHFKMKLTKPVPTGTDLSISVIKTDKQGNSYESTAITYKVKYTADTKPEITSVKREGNTVTLTGKSFFTSDTKPLTVSVLAGTGTPLDVKDFKRTSKQISFDAKALNLKAACYSTTVKAADGQSASSKDLFPEVPTLKLDSAAVSGPQIIATGMGFVDLANCGVPLKFQIQEVKQGAATQPQDVTNLNVQSDQKAVFDLPTKPIKAKWKVVVSLGKDRQASSEVK